MLLKEIIDPNVDYQEGDYPKTIDYPKGKPKGVNEPDDKRGEILGSGSFASVENDPDDPHMAIRNYRYPQQNLYKYDDYYLYIMELKRLGVMGKNPYFPRIYDIKYYEDSSGKDTYKVQMEKLFPLQSLSDDEVKSIFKNVFNWDDEKLEERFKVNKYFDPYEILAYHISDNYFKSHNSDYEVDPLFAKAVGVIKNIIRKYSDRLDLKPDIHSKNLMIRRGRYLPQIVFSDPVYNKTQLNRIIGI